ncbi:MAG: AMP-binding protein [Alphaproteobacteria bacterium]|nr:AMP-binding protein [Alphaproteobacteria bacterium]
MNLKVKELFNLNKIQKMFNYKIFLAFTEMMLFVKVYHSPDSKDNLLILFSMMFVYLMLASKETRGQRRNPLFRLLEVVFFCLILGVLKDFVPSLVANIIVLVGLLAELFRVPIFEENEKYHCIFGKAAVSFKTYSSAVIGTVLAAVLNPVITVYILIFAALIRFLYAAFYARDLDTYSVSFFNFKEIKNDFRIFARYPLLFRSALGVSWILSMGYLLLFNVDKMTNSNFALIVVDVLIVVFAFSSGFSLGVRLSRRVIDLTFMPLNTALMTLSLLMMTVLSTSLVALPLFVLFLALNAFNAGMYTVPMVLHMRTKIRKNNIVSAYVTTKFQEFACFAFALCLTLLRRALNLEMSWGLALLTIIGVVALVYECKISPKDFQRSLIRTLFEMVYQVTVKNSANFTKAGHRVLIIANHTSKIDALLISAFMPERINVVLPIEIKDTIFAKVCKLFADVHILDIKDAMAMRPIISLLKSNKKVLVFPERRSSVTGSLMKIYPGIGIVAEKTNSMILPICITGAQNSKFSLQKKIHKTYWLTKIRLTLFEPTKIYADPNLDKRKRNYAISLQIYRIMSRMLVEGYNYKQNIFNALINSSVIYGSNKEIAEDASRKVLTYRNLLMKSYVLGGTVASKLENEEYVGVMMPNVLANVVLYFGLVGNDKVPAMLNFSSGVAQILACMQAVQIKTVITSHGFIEQGKLEHIETALKDAGIRLLYLEDIAKNMTTKDKIVGLLRFAFKIKAKRSSEQAATVLFTSGSEGMPKAVLLSHQNFMFNGHQGVTAESLNPSDVFFNALPMFHSFGLGMATVMTTLHGIKTIYYPSPLHYRVIPELIYDTNSTVLVGTDTFLAGYGETAHPYDFYTLRLAVVGAEKLKQSTKDLYLKKFGIRIIEGYGATECAPLISVNSNMYYKEGSVGRLIPALDYKLEEVEGINDGKRLLLHGKNIMMGYIYHNDPGVLHPVPNGWYDTGDIVEVDDEDFIFIKGRAKRFAKIGGEMVSLTAVEIAINELYPETMNGIVAISDPKKGEKLVLYTTSKDAEIAQIKQFIRQKGLSDLSAPAVVNMVDEIPLVGAGKVDYQKLKRMAEEQSLV